MSLVNLLTCNDIHVSFFSEEFELSGIDWDGRLASDIWLSSMVDGEIVFLHIDTDISPQQLDQPRETVTLNRNAILAIENVAPKAALNVANSMVPIRFDKLRSKKHVEPKIPSLVSLLTTTFIQLLTLAEVNLIQCKILHSSLILQV